MSDQPTTADRIVRAMRGLKRITVGRIAKQLGEAPRRIADAATNDERLTLRHAKTRNLESAIIEALS